MELSEIPAAFVSALRANEALMELLTSGAADDDTRRDDGSLTPPKSARIFTVARTVQDEREDLLPYVIITPEQMTEDTTKDGIYQFQAVVNVLCCTYTYTKLVELLSRVREAVRDYFDSNPTEMEPVSITGAGVKYDPGKPCFFKTITYTVNYN